MICFIAVLSKIKSIAENVQYLDTKAQINVHSKIQTAQMAG
jgi:hypothetical protein